MARRTRTPRTQKRRIHHLGTTPRPIRHPKCRTTLLQNQLPPFPRCRHEGVPCQYRHRTQRTTTPLHQSTRHGSPELGTATRTLKNIHIKGFIMKRFTAAALSIVLSVGVSAGVAQAQDFSDPATTPGKITAHPKQQFTQNHTASSQTIMQLLIFRLWVLENLQKFVVHCISLFDIAYSLIVLKNARQILTLTRTISAL